MRTLDLPWRIAFLAFALLLLSVLVGMGLMGIRAAPSASAEATVSVPLRPNIVVILVDDLDQMTTPYWDAMPRTKRLLVDRGLTFTHSFSPDPTCCPSRTALLTGLCGHNSGVLANSGPYGGEGAFKNPLDLEGQPQQISNEERTIAIQLQSAGYRTALIGKYLNGYSAGVPLGWNEWHAFTGMRFYTGYNYDMIDSVDGAPATTSHYGSRASDYATDVVRNKAVRFIQRASEPFFAYVAPSAPHDPIPAAPRHATIAKQWVGKFNSDKRPSYNEADISDKPDWLIEIGDTMSVFLTTDPPVHHLPAAHVLFPETDFESRTGSLYAVDDLVVAIVGALAAKGRLDRTVLVFTSDNGYQLGAHRLVAKRAPYEESLRVPLVVAGRGIRQGISQAMVSQQDFAPTFLELAGVAVPSEMNGRSFAKFFALPDELFTAAELDRELPIESDKGSDDDGAEYGVLLSPKVKKLLATFSPPSWRGIRTRDYTYVEYYLTGPHEYEIYDLREDPYQLNNKWADAEWISTHQFLIDYFQARLGFLKTCTGKDCE